MGKSNRVVGGSGLGRGYPHGGRGREDEFEVFWEGGQSGKGIIFEM